MQLVESMDVEFMDKQGQGGQLYNYTTLNLKDIKKKRRMEKLLFFNCARAWLISNLL